MNKLRANTSKRPLIVTQMTQNPKQAQQTLIIYQKILIKQYFIMQKYPKVIQMMKLNTIWAIAII